MSLTPLVRIHAGGLAAGPLWLLPAVMLGLWTAGCGDSALSQRDNPPGVEMAWPDGDLAALEGEELTLLAQVTGFGGDDGVEVLWSSDLDGTLVESWVGHEDGGGTPLAWSDLSPGDHTITVQVADSAGEVAWDSIGVAVAADERPLVRIDLPASDEHIQGVPIVFAGVVTDDHESPADLAVTWSSDLDGVIGDDPAAAAGTTVLVTSSLSVGTHLITLEAEDRLGPAAAQIEVRVYPPETCNGADDDGDGLVDEGFDADGDGVADCDDIEECDGVDNDGDGVVDQGFDDLDGDGLADCIDRETCDGVDNDGDGLIDEDFTDLDGDGLADCLDTEECDGLDNDGDGATDEGFDDTDSDGIGDCVETEDCDGLDNDGDGLVDEDFDQDGDGFATCAGDCDDADPAVYPGVAEICDGVDQDCDGVADEDFDLDGDGHLDATACAGIGGDDCDDTDATVYAGAPEECDGVDDDCDGLVDEGFDADGDGYLDLTACAGIGGNDCDDADAAVNPAATEACNGIDDNCDLFVDEGFDLDGDGHLDTAQCGEHGSDCDDADVSVYEGAPELCDGVDNDCDGAADEGYDLDGDGYYDADTCPNGDDCDDTNPYVHPGVTEVCNGIDDDCDGIGDEGYDADADGHLDESLCADGDDCDDTDPTVHPGAFESCDGLDNDCDGYADEGYTDDDGDGTVDCHDDDGDGYSEDDGDCDDLEVLANPGQLELQDGIDNDCDGDVDEDYCLVPVDQTSIQACIDVAADGMTVLVLPGTYYENIDFVGKNITVESQDGPEVTSIDGGGADSVVTMNSGEWNASLSGFTITNGSADYGAGIHVEDSDVAFDDLVLEANVAAEYGGGMYLDGGSWTIDACTFEDNEASYGAGIYATGLQLEVTDSLFHGNVATGNTGAGMYLNVSQAVVLDTDLTHNTGKAIYSTSSLLEVDTCLIDSNHSGHGEGAGIYVRSGTSFIHNCTITNNACDGYTGGGIYAPYSGPLTVITDSLIEGNFANYGAGIGAVGDELQVYDTIIRDNYAAVSGGGIYGRPVDITLVGCTLEDNVAADTGGAIFVNNPYATEDPFTLFIQDSVLHNNQANQGGAIGMAVDVAEIDISQTAITDNVGVTEGGGLYMETGMLDLENVLIAGNTTYGEGGGISLRNVDAAMSNVTVAGNTSYGDGAGMYVAGDPALPLTLVNAIVAANSGNCGLYETDGSVPVFEYDDVWGHAGGEYCGTLVDPTGLDGNLSVDPLFTDAANGDYTLAAGSPCIDAGDPDAAYDDLDGTRNDMGAFGGPYGGW